ncbi:MAG: hypothetical protein KKC84_07900 [Candidatus Omnitrophica bacterium]|nr:hypothetical protein [Candidatus Omnitrophota bacterium]
MKIFTLIMMCALFFTVAGWAQTQPLLLDDFEGVISGGPEGTVDFGAGNGSAVQVVADAQIKNTGAQSLKVTYDAISGGYMYVARGLGLDAKNSCWLLKPEEIAWDSYKSLTFYMYGQDSKAQVAFDVKDNGNEMWRFFVEDNFKGWKKVVCPFEQFFARSDWQPDSADKNEAIDFPLKSFQFEPLPEAEGILYFDTVELS